MTHLRGNITASSLLATLILAASACRTPAPEGAGAASTTLAIQGSGEAGAIKVTTEPFPPAKTGQLGLCTYNISFLGAWPDKKNAALVDLVKNCDVVVIQELAYPPEDLEIAMPDGGTKVLEGSETVREFFKLMANVGLDGVVLSEAKTGPSTNTSNGRQSDFFVAFYRPSKVTVASDLPAGYVDEPLVGNERFDRVPYAFPFRAKVSGGATGVDFVLISVHLHPTKGTNIAAKKKDKAFRVAEFRHILKWIKKQNQTLTERDYVILGDTNVEDEEEYEAFLGEVSPEVQAELSAFSLGDDESLRKASRAYRSLNATKVDGDLVLFGTNLKMIKPYDHVFFDPSTSSEIKPSLLIIDTATLFDISSAESAIQFTGLYSDHNPLAFSLTASGDDD